MTQVLTRRPAVREAAGRLLLVFAHPDDESFFTAGTVARHVAAGGRAALVSATRGERGSQPNPPVCDPADLGRVRSGELRQACRAMGVSRLTFLGYVDQGLASADPKEASARVARVMASYRPDAVVTFGPEGIYQHPDHVAIHHLAVAAFDRVWGGAGGSAGRPAPRLWYVAPSSAFWRYRRDDWVAAGRDTGGAGETTDNGEVGDHGAGSGRLAPSRRPIEPGLPEAAIDIRGVLDRKIAALLAHRSQRHNVERTFGRFYDLALGRPKDPEALEKMGREFFSLARGPRPRHVLEDGLAEPDA